MTVTVTVEADPAAGRTSLADYLGSVLRRVRPLPPLDLDLTQAYGNVLAEDVPAPHGWPSSDCAGLDGYAVRLGEAAPLEPRLRLSVIGDLTAASWRPLLAAVQSPPGLRAQVAERRGGGCAVQPLPGGRFTLSGLAGCNGLLVLGERVTSAPVGSTVDVLMLDRRR